MEKIKELESLNVKVKAALSEATAETGKEAVAAADMRREIKRLTEEVTQLAPLPEQLAAAQQQLAQVTESHSTAAARADGLATEAAEVGGLKEQLAAAVAERDAAAGKLAEAQEIQQELQGADDKRKARFAKMKASYDTLLEERDATILAAASPTNKATMMDVSCDYSLCLPFCMLCYLHSSAAAQLRSIAFDSPDHTCCYLVCFWPTQSNPMFGEATSSSDSEDEEDVIAMD